MAFLSDAAGELKHIPWWAWAGGAVALLLVGSHVLGGRAAASDTGASADTSGTDDGLGGVGASTGGQTTGTTGTTSTAGSPTGTGTTSTTNTGGQTTTTSKTYTIARGDTLYGIASKYHVDEPDLYSLNKSTIETTAKAHGYTSSDGGHWIFPGTVLKIPA